MSGGTALTLPKARCLDQESHNLPKPRRRPFDRIVIWLLVSGTLGLDDQVNVAVEDVQEIQYLVH